MSYKDAIGIPKFCVGDLSTEEGAIDFLRLNPNTVLSVGEIQASAGAAELSLGPEAVDYYLEFGDE